MADQVINSGAKTLNEKWVDMGDGTHARRVAASSVNADGSQQTALPPGRAAAANSVPTVMSNEDYAAIRQTYRRAAAVGPTAGDAVIVSGVTTAGTITLTLAGGGSVTLSVPLGSSVLPFAATAAALGTAVGGTFQSLFYL